MEHQPFNLDEIEHISIHAWLINHGIKTETGQRLDFQTHRYLFDIYRDNAKYLVCSKAGQIGFSTMAILKTIHLARYKKIDVGYILPTVEMVQKFVGSKVNRLAQQNPILQSWMRDKDSIFQKQIGENYIHYLGAMTDRSAIMLSLDMLIADEYDKAPQEILEIYDSRLQHSQYGYKWIFSNPTIPDFGVYRFMQRTDWKKWFIKHSCGEKYILDESCIDYKAELFRCPKCQGEITNEERRMGEWEATQLGEAGWSGYLIPLWINPMISAAKIAEYKHTKTPEYFANFVAGEAYVGSENALSLPLLERLLTPRVNEQKDTIIIGVDTGHNIHYVLMNKQGIFYHGYCPSVAENPTPGYDPYDEIEKRLKQFPNSIVIADQGGDLIGIRKLQAKYPSRVFLCWFVKETRNQQIIRWGEGEEFGKVLVDRNRAMQLFISEMIDGRTVFHGSLKDWQPYFDHWLNVYRVKEIEGQDENDPQYKWRWIWKRKGPDHWAIATVYARIGLDRFASQEASIIELAPLDLPVGRMFNNDLNF